MTRLFLSMIALLVVLFPLRGNTQIITTQHTFDSITGSQVESQPPAKNQTSAKRRETSITGRLINDSGQPIPNAAVYVRKVGASSNLNRNVGTDEDGRFRADDLTPGAYTISASVPGFVLETDSVGRQYYRPGEVATLRMIKGGVITGTVTNALGEPIIAARVTAVRVRDAQGRPLRSAGASGNSRQTDDRGVYRMYGLQSGAYLVVVSGSTMSFYGPSAYDGDAPTYYPSTTRDAAVEVNVHTGDEIAGIDIRYRGERGHVVSGKFSGSVGSDSASRGVSLYFIHANGALESGTYIPWRGGEQGFALYGIPDGEFELIAQVDSGTERAAASPPRHITVKGADVTGIELAIAPLGSIAGRLVLKPLPEAELKDDCKSSRNAHLDETVIVGRRDEKASGKDQTNVGFLTPTDTTPEANGEFKITGLISGRYRMEMRLGTEYWFVQSITAPAGSKQQNDVTGGGLMLGTGQRMADVTINVAEGAAALRGKVVAASEGSVLPSRLRVHLVPAEPDSADLALRFAEADVDNDGAFSMSNLAPGRYFVLTRMLSDEEQMDRTPRPLLWDSTSRAKLRRDAESANITIELQRCQRITDYVVKYSRPSGRKRAPTSKP